MRRVTKLVSCAALAAMSGCSPPRQISDSGFGAYEVSLAAWHDGLAAAWYDTRHGNAELYVQHLDADGGAAGPEIRLTETSGESYEADIAAITDAFAIAWYEKERDGALGARLGVWARDGTPRWSAPIAIGGGHSRNPAVRSFGDALFCAWIESDVDGREFVWGGWWELDGRPRGVPRRLGAAGSTTWSLNAAITPSGEAWVVFDVQAGTEVEELFLATLGGGRTALRQLTVDDGIPSKYPDLGIAGERAAIAWFDERDGNPEVYLAAGLATEFQWEIEGRARRVTQTPGSSIGAYLAWNDDRIGLTWSDDSDGNYEVYFQTFDGEGRPLTHGERLAETPAHSMIPAIKPWRDGFALAWDEVVAATETARSAGAYHESSQAEVLFAFR
ncbi:MAG TPA: hypothetical protein VIQ99_09705 [Gammaproteobacteria bacterium]